MRTSAHEYVRQGCAFVPARPGVAICVCIFRGTFFLPLDVTKVEAKLLLINLVSVWLVFFCSPVCLSLSLHASALVYKRFLCTQWQFIILISLAAFLVQMLHGICWHLNSPRYIPFSNICIRVDPCVTQSFVQLLVPGARHLVFTHMYEPQGTWKRPFHP